MPMAVDFLCNLVRGPVVINLDCRLSEITGLASSLRLCACVRVYVSRKFDLCELVGW